jgi:hypothetical protein
MINRNVLKCISCGKLTLTRVQIGHKDRQRHTFPCATCGVEITITLDLDQKNAGLKYRDPENAEWVESNTEKFDHAVYLSDELLVPAGPADHGFPFIEAMRRYADFEAYRRDEGERQGLVRAEFKYLERCSNHFEKQNYALFDKEAQIPGGALTRRKRLGFLYSAYSARFAHLTRKDPAKTKRILEKIAAVQKAGKERIKDLGGEYLKSGKLLALWKEVRGVRSAFIRSYDYIQPLYQLLYWRKEFQDFGQVKLADKRFQELQPLYVQCFETLCRLLVIALAYELVEQNGSLVLTTKKGQMTMGEFAALPNASKRDHFSKFPLLDEIFVPVLDTDFRNGIGHHSAHYDPKADEIVLYDSKGSGTISRTISYTEFCGRLIELFTAFERAAHYFQALHLSQDGKLS